MLKKPSSWETFRVNESIYHLVKTNKIAENNNGNNMLKNISLLCNPFIETANTIYPIRLKRKRTAANPWPPLVMLLILISLSHVSSTGLSRTENDILF